MGKALTDAGKRQIRDFLIGETETIAIGTGTTDPSTSDTSLESKVIEKTSTDTDAGAGDSEHVIRLSTTEANGYALTELGSNDVDSNLLARLTFVEINKTSDFEVEFTLTKKTRNK